MTKKRVSLTTEQKLDFAKMMVDDGFSIDQVMEISGASESAVKRWKKQYQEEKQGILTQHASGLTPAHQRIKALEKQLARANRDIDILKKATALFVKGTQ